MCSPYDTSLPRPPQQVTIGRGKAGPRGGPAAGASTLKDEQQALYTCSVSPAHVQGRTWVAYGGLAGLVRCQRICTVFSDS